MDIVLNSEKELRERLVGLSLSTVLVRMSDEASKAESGLWNPVGVAQMVKWVVLNKDHVSCQLSPLASKIEEFGTRYVFYPISLLYAEIFLVLICTN